jgi:hypothetical protein
LSTFAIDCGKIAQHSRRVGATRPQLLFYKGQIRPHISKIKHPDNSTRTGTGSSRMVEADVKDKEICDFHCPRVAQYRDFGHAADITLECAVSPPTQGASNHAHDESDDEYGWAARDGAVASAGDRVGGNPVGGPFPLTPSQQSGCTL